MVVEVFPLFGNYGIVEENYIPVFGRDTRVNERLWNIDYELELVNQRQVCTVT
jgi:hypothetical protein